MAPQKTFLFSLVRYPSENLQHFQFSVSQIILVYKNIIILYYGNIFKSSLKTKPIVLHNSEKTEY